MQIEQILSVATALTIASAAVTAASNEPNGRIVDQKPLLLDDRLRREIEAQEVEGKSRVIAPTPLADICATIARVDIAAITYLSDGLKVRGFILAPKKEGRFPVIIFNRGGCRETVGVLAQAYVARWLAPLADWGWSLPASIAAPPRRTPILILHGQSDWSALPYGALEMAEELLRLSTRSGSSCLRAGTTGWTCTFPRLTASPRSGLIVTYGTN